MSYMPYPVSVVRLLVLSGPLHVCPCCDGKPLLSLHTVSMEHDTHIIYGLPFIAHPCDGYSWLITLLHLELNKT